MIDQSVYGFLMSKNLIVSLVETKADKINHDYVPINDNIYRASSIYI